jgi:hypothetical protein
MCGTRSGSSSNTRSRVAMLGWVGRRGGWTQEQDLVSDSYSVLHFFGFRVSFLRFRLLGCRQNNSVDLNQLNVATAAAICLSP